MHIGYNPVHTCIVWHQPVVYLSMFSMRNYEE